jgi:hypothetical protein
MSKAGLARDGLYLVRPDGYVAYASIRQDAEAMANLLSRYAIRLDAESASQPQPASPTSPP